MRSIDTLLLIIAYGLFSFLMGAAYGRRSARRARYTEDEVHDRILGALILDEELRERFGRAKEAS